MLKIIEQSAMILARSANGNPLIAVIVVMIFFLAFNLLERQIEKLIWGERFEHWLDPVFILVFIGYAAYTVYACAVFSSIQKL